MPTKTKTKPKRTKKVNSVTIAADAPPLRTDTYGVIRVGKTRVTLDTLVATYFEGCTAEEIADQYPALGIAEIYSAIGYYLNHKAELDQYLEQRRIEGEQIRREVEARFPQKGLREMLLARLKNRSKS